MGPVNTSKMHSRGFVSRPHHALRLYISFPSDLPWFTRDSRAKLTSRASFSANMNRFGIVESSLSAWFPHNFRGIPNRGHSRRANPLCILQGAPYLNNEETYHTMPFIFLFGLCLNRHIVHTILTALYCALYSVERTAIGLSVLLLRNAMFIFAPMNPVGSILGRRHRFRVRP